MIKDYASASDYLGRKEDRPLSGRASRIVRRSPSAIAIRYQSTDVVTYHANGKIVLDSGGWLSVTTKARMSEYTRVRLYAVKGQWFVGGDVADRPSLFYNGMVINSEGEPLEPRYPNAKDIAQKRTLDKQVTAYIKGFAAHIKEHGLENPSGGDCWGCCMQVQGEATVTQGAMRLQGKPTPHGRTEPMGVDHYREHIRESYYVPSLLFNAIKAAGYSNPPFIWQLIQSGKDGGMAERILRGYFKNLKPALLADMAL